MEYISSRRNPLATHFKKLGSSSAYRRESGEFLCDGRKLLEDAVKSGADVTAVITASHMQLPLSGGTRVHYADRGLIESLSPLKNAQDTLFACRIPLSHVGFDDTTEKYVDDFSEMTGTHVLLDGVQDPGNVGAIIRTANAFGMKSVILTGGCADPYNPKTIRASMGAIFRLSVYHMSLSGIAGLRDSGVRFVGAVLREGCRSIYDVDLSNSVIAVGSEGSGLSEDVLALCSERLTIPIAPECESLNAAVAAAVIMWEAARRTERREERGERRVE